MSVLYSSFQKEVQRTSDQKMQKCKVKLNCLKGTFNAVVVTSVLLLLLLILHLFWYFVGAFCGMDHAVTNKM
jgi:hypothetical protein